MQRLTSRLLLISSYLFLFASWISPFSITSEIKTLHTLYPIFQFWNSFIDGGFNLIGLTVSPLTRTIVSTTILMIISQNFTSLLYTGHLLHSLTPAYFVEINKIISSKIKELLTVAKLIRVLWRFRPRQHPYFRRPYRCYIVIIPLQLTCLFILIVIASIHIALFVSAIVFIYICVILFYPVVVTYSTMTYMYFPFFIILTIYCIFNLLSNPIGQQVAAWLQNMASP
jgi:hypothetical protein